MEIWHAIGVCGSALGLIVVAFVVVGMTVLTSRRLRHVGDNLHATGHNASWSTTTCGISRSRWSSKSFCQLLHKCLTDIVGRDVNCISYAKDDQRSFRR